MKNRSFWKFMRAGSLLGWVFLFYGLFSPFEGPIVRIVWWCVLLGWGIGHPLELTQSLPVARDRGVTPEQAFIKTMLFGFTWWVPLKMGVIDE